MNSVKKIELVLENCEVIDVTNAVGDFSIRDISVEVNRIASNCIAKTVYAKEVFIQLYKDGEFKYLRFNDNNDPIARLKSYKDITSIEITYEDYSESYYVDYNEDENEGILGADNINQKTYETENSLFILISATKTFDDFKIDEVDSEWFLDQDVTARIDLKNNGWKELFNNVGLYEFYLDSEKLIVCIGKDIIRFITTGDIIKINTFTPAVFSELLSYLFYKFEIKSNLNQEDFKYIKLDNIAITQDNKHHQFTLDGHTIDIQCDTYDDTCGIVQINNNYNISIKDMLSFMWILLKIIETD